MNDTSVNQLRTKHGQFFILGLLRPLIQFSEYVCWAILFWTVAPILLLTLVIPVQLYRLGVKGLQKILHPSWIGMMNVRDALFSEQVETGRKKSRSRSRSNSTMLGVFVLEGQLDLEEFQQQFLQNVVLHRRFNDQSMGLETFPYEKLTLYFENWMGFPFWKRETSFSIENHIRILDNPSRRRREEELFEIAGDLVTRPFKRGQSPWEIILVPRLIRDEPGRAASPPLSKFAFFFRLHHTLCDGYSFQKMLVQNMCGNLDNLQVKSARPSSHSRSRPSSSFNQFSSFSSMYDRIIFMAKTAGILGLEHARMLLIDQDHNNWHLSQHQLSDQVHTVALDLIPFNDFRLLSKKLGGVNPTSVVYSIICGGIRAFRLQHYGEAREESEEMQALVTWPVANHPLQGFVNHWTFSSIKFPVGPEFGDFAQRTRIIQKNFQGLKESKVPELTWTMMPLFSSLPSPLLNFVSRNRKTTLTLTNLAGPTEKLTVFGKWPLLKRTFCVARLRGNSGMQFGVLTYLDQTWITITVDRSVLPSYALVKLLAQCIQNEHQKQMLNYCRNYE